MAMEYLKHHLGTSAIGNGQKATENKSGAEGNRSSNANALKFFTSHCEPEGRGNSLLAPDCFVASLLAMTGHLLRLQ